MSENIPGWYQIDGEIIGRVTTEFASAVNQETFSKALDIIAFTIRDIIGAHQSAVSYIPDGDFTRAIHSTSLSSKYDEYRKYNILPNGKGIWSLIFEDGNTMRLTKEELYSHPRFCHFSNMKTESGLEHPPLPGWLAVPVKRSDGSPIGLLQLSDKEEGEFTEEDESILKSFAILIGASFEVQYTKDEVQTIKEKDIQLERHLLELKLIHEGTEAVALASTLEEAFQNCLDLICRTIHWPIGHIYVPDDTNNCLVSSHIWYVNKDVQAKELIETTENYSFKKDIGLPGRIWRSKSSVWIKDVFKDDNFPRAKSCRNLEIISAIGFPIIVNDELVAVMEFFSCEREEPDRNILRTFELLGQQIGHVFDKKRIERKMEVFAHFDAVTELPNRTFFQESLEKIIEGAKRSKSKFALLFIDIDNFKQINDNFGHGFGDTLLKIISEKLKNTIKKSDYIARIGGDEFVIILRNKMNVDEVLKISERLLKSIKHSIFIKSQEVNPSISIGVSIYPDMGFTPEALLMHADTAMYKAKNLGKNTVCLYTKQLNHQVSYNLKVETSLRHAIERNEFYLVYQPQVSLIDEQIMGIEVLLRWSSAELRGIGPDVFIPIAESAGLMVDIGYWILEESFQVSAEISKKFPKLNLPFCINCSVSQIEDINLIEFIKEGTKRYKIPNNQITLEITETMLMQKPTFMQHQLTKLKELGVGISIDDFGTGYSSLSRLRQMPVSVIKVDKSFVDGLPTNKSDKEIVKTIIQLSKALDLHVIAEGVENKKQSQALIECDCFVAQGYLYAKPLEKKLLLDYLSRN
ncbi:MAG: GGDEF domain-containing protein [Legionellaceae bacterium]|nr:GGDEF domain-containing protein [Legionellaceae bacterium]